MSAKAFTIGGHTISYGGFLLREAGAGALTITKTVTGTGFDPAKTFELTVTFNKPVTYNGTTSTVHTFNLASGQSVTITDIPETTAYSVEEAPLSPSDIASGYSFEGIMDGSGTIPNGNVHAIAINGYGGLPAKTLRLLYPDGVTPTFAKGTGTQMSSSPNVWDLHYDNPDWSELLRNHEILKVLGAGDTSGVTNMHYMFHNCPRLNEVHLFNTSGVTDMVCMFGGCRSLTTVPLFDTSACTNMFGMFSFCTSLASVPLFDTSKVTDMREMFIICDLTSVPLFDTSACTNMYMMFYGCRNLITVPLFDTSKVTDMGEMFDGCYSLTSVPLFDTSKVTVMAGMFASCTNVGSGALALYQQASSQAVPPVYHSMAFRDCGINTTTGAAELAQIPSDWK